VSTPAPPRIARRVLAWSLPADAREHVVDELDEVFQTVRAARGARAGDLWYVRQSASFSTRFLIEQLRERAIGGSLPQASSLYATRGRIRGFFEAWTHDLTHAARRLVQAPGFTAVVVLTLALAVGVNAAIFTIVDAVLIDPLPFSNADRLVSIRGSAPGSDLPPRFFVGPEFFVAYRDDADRLEDIGMFQTAQTTVRAGDRVDRLFVVLATTSIFSTLDVQPVVGRLPTKLDDTRRANVMVISHWLWTTWFASDRTIVGRTIEVSGQKREVIGVMGADFRFPDSRTALWGRASISDERKIQPGRLGFQLVARMKPGTRPDDLTTQLTAVAKQLPRRFGGDARYAELIDRHQPVVRTLEDSLVGDYSRPLWIVLGTVAVVFLIACANIANLFVVRSESRRRDLAVRSALGAGRGGLIRAQMSEALLLAILGGVGAIVVARFATPLLVRAAPEGVPNLDLVALTPISLLFTGALSVLAACLFGLVPAIRFSRARNLGDLRQSGGIGTSRGRFARSALVVAQTASALVLLVAAGLLARSFWELRHVTLGYSTEDIFSFQIAPSRPELRDGPSFARFHEDFMKRIAALPDVESVGVVNELPLDEASNLGRFATEFSERSGAQARMLPFTAAGGDYFGTMGIPVVSGRSFEAADHRVGASNVLVSRAAARALWPDGDAVGRRVR
jgi:putative ABC transport system permease protein